MAGVTLMTNINGYTINGVKKGMSIEEDVDSAQKALERYAYIADTTLSSINQKLRSSISGSEELKTARQIMQSIGDFMAGQKERPSDLQLQAVRQLLDMLPLLQQRQLPAERQAIIPELVRTLVPPPTAPDQSVPDHWSAQLGFGDHHVMGDYGDRHGDDKKYTLEIQRERANSGTREHYKVEAELYTPALAKPYNPSLKGANWHDTATCAVGYGQSQENPDGSSWKAGINLGVANGVCKDVLTDVQNWYHTALGYTNLRQSPASTGLEPFGGVEGMYTTQPLWQTGDAGWRFGINGNVQGNFNSMFGTLKVGPVIEGSAGGVAVMLYPHGDLTPYDRRNMNQGAQTINAGVTARLDINIGKVLDADIPGSPVISLQGEQLLNTTMPGTGVTPPPQLEGTLRINF